MDIKIRPAIPEDAAQIARLHAKSWQVAYQGIIHQSCLDGLDVELRTQRSRDGLASSKNQTFLAFNQATLAGFTSVGPSRDPAYPDHFELLSIYLDPAYTGTNSCSIRLCSMVLSKGLPECL